jgi:hypothetical protein
MMLDDLLATHGLAQPVDGVPGSFAFLVTINWPAVVLGSALLVAFAWTISSADRTRRLASLIRAACSRPGSGRRK